MSHPTTAVAATSSAQQPLELPDLVRWFLPPADRARLVGLEIEYGLVRPGSGISVGYDEPDGSRALLSEILEASGGSPIFEGPSLVGVELPDRSTFTLEMGGALEYSSRPHDSLTAAVSQAREQFLQVARMAEPMGIRLLTGGLLPFDSAGTIGWAPKPRTAIMRRHFDALGEGGRFGDCVMGLTLSTQVSLDAVSVEEYFEKLKTLIAVSPFIAALVANTPQLAASSGCTSSQRMRYWRQIDPSRCQDLTARLLTVEGVEDLVGVLTSLPMIYRRSGNRYLAAPGEPFADLLSGGFPDGSYPTMADWVAHLAQLWPAVRPRQTLETRLPDGQPWLRLETLPALFLGLVEDPGIRRRVAERVADIPVEALETVTTQAAQEGLCGLSGPVREVGAELVELARSGLSRRVAQGLEAPGLLQSLEPVREVAATGRTFASGLLEQWNTGWQQRPERYVEAMAVPVE
jgi:glutamate--cysteine ligase